MAITSVTATSPPRSSRKKRSTSSSIRQQPQTQHDPGPEGRSFTRGSLPPIDAIRRYKEIVAPHVESFNYFLDTGLRDAVACLNPVEARLSADGESGPLLKLWVEDCEVGFPTGDGGAKLITPRECRERGLMYAAPIRATFRVQREGGGVMRMQRVLGELPIMVGTSRCRLAGKTAAELVALKEEAGECGGYFVVNGIERIIRLLQMPRRNHVMAISRNTFKGRGTNYTDKGVIMRCVRPDQSSITVTLHYLTTGNAIFRVTILKQEFLVPIVLVLKALREMTDKELFQRVTLGDEDNTYLVTRVEMLLREATEFATFSRPKALAYLGFRFRAVLGLSSTHSDAECGRALLDRFVCVHLGSHGDKQECLLHMLRKLYTFVQGRCRADNPDSFMNQELLLPGHLYTVFVKEKLEEVLVNSFLQLRKECRDDLPRALAATQDEAYWTQLLTRHGSTVGKKAAYLLSTGNLVSRTGMDLMQISGYTVVAERLNFLRFLSHFQSVHRGQFFTTMKTTAVRKLLPESFGFLCPVHTPDGSPCGLLNHLATPARVLCYEGRAEGGKGGGGFSTDLLVSLGVSPGGAGSADGALILSKDHLPVLVDGRVIGGAPLDVCRRVVIALRRLKAASSPPPCEDGIVGPDTEKLRGKGRVDATLEIAFIPPARGGPAPGLFLFTGPARMIRPVLHLETGQIEYIGPMEQVFMEIALLPEDLRAGETTHQELDPTNMLSLVASLTPFSDYNQSPRNMYQCQMGKQTMGTPTTSYPHRTDNKLYRILTPQAPIVQTRRHAEYGMDEFPQGTNAVVAVISYTGYDMEDAMILSKASYDRGMAAADVYKTKSVSLRRDMRGGAKRPQLRFSNQRTAAVFAKRKHPGPVGGHLFEGLEADGLPVVGAWVKEGDVLYSAVDSLTGEVESGKHKESETACVEAVRLLGLEGAPGTTEPLDTVSITLRFPRRPIIGDKFSSRHGQKGVLSILWPQEDMPFTESGMSPDVIINPHAFPSRMTIGMLIESMAGKSGSLHGMYQDATPFAFHEERRAIDYFGEQLRAAGYAYYGSEPLYSGLSGTLMHADIFIGVVYYQRLRHMVSDKSQVRATGPVNQLTRQPIKGRKRHGGIRFGEMERDSLLSHGTSYLLHDRLMNCSDRHLAHVCQKCGSLVGPTLTKSAVLSAAQAGPVTAVAAVASSQSKAICRLCGGQARAVALPYVFRYLANELTAMNIKLSLGLKEA
ncbi:dna-directed rna polymerase i complex subunit rpa2 [Nannochloropsis oceanica]